MTAVTTTSKHSSVDDNSGECTLQSAGRLSRLTSLPAHGSLVDPHSSGFMPQCQPFYALETTRPSRSFMLHIVRLCSCKLVLPLRGCFQTQLSGKQDPWNACGKQHRPSGTGCFWCISLHLLFCLKHNSFVQLQKEFHILYIHKNFICHGSDCWCCRNGQVQQTRCWP